MTTSSIKIMIPCEIHKAWETITAVEAYHTWRSDVSKTELISEKQFITYTQSNYATTFTVTAMEPYQRLNLNWKTAISEVIGQVYSHQKGLKPKSILQQVSQPNSSPQDRWDKVCLNRLIYGRKKSGF